jgi:hypothetical protein
MARERRYLVVDRGKGVHGRFLGVRLREGGFRLIQGGIVHAPLAVIGFCVVGGVGGGDGFFVKVFVGEYVVVVFLLIVLCLSGLKDRRMVGGGHVGLEVPLVGDVRVSWLKTISWS